MDNNSALAQIINPMNPETFLNQYWPEKHLVVHGEPERFHTLPGIGDIKSLDDILKIYKNVVMVYGNAVIDATEGISDRMLVPPDQALTWYEKGAAIEFDYLDIYLPQIHHLISQLRKDLHLPEGTLAKSIAYAAPRGGGLKPHFDAYCNFVFQIQGRKAWIIAPNENVVNPLQHYDLAEAPYIPDELSSYWHGTPPEHGLPKAETVELKPGSLFVVPRGLWHSTESGEGTLSINITFGQPTWLELVLAEIRSRLITNVSWRELALDVTTLDPQHRGALQEQLTYLLNNLTQDVGNITPDDLFRHNTQSFDLYQETQQVFRQLLHL